MLERIIALTLTLTLTACSLAPPYRRPDLPTASIYPAELQPQGSGSAASAIAWQDFFADARLQALIRAALANNRDLRIAVARIDEARALYGIQRADQWPNVSAGASYSRSHTPASVSLLRQPLLLEQYQATLNLTAFELDFWGRVRNLKDAALAQYLATEEARRAAAISLIASVADSYLVAGELDERIALAKKTLESRDESYRLAKLRYDSGVASALDLAQVETLLTQAKSELAALERNRAQTLNALALLAGAELNDLPPRRSLAEQGIVQHLPAGLPSDLLTQRPDVLAAEQRLKAANASIGAARAAFFPRITLTGSFGTASSELDGLFGGGSRIWSFLPQLTLPLFDAGRNQANLSLSEARRNIAVAEYERTVQTAFREVADALAARRWLAEQVTHQEAGLAAQAERARLAELRYRSGVASYLDVLDAQRELFNAEQNLVQTRRALLSSSVALYRALGGGLADG